MERHRQETEAAADARFVRLFEDLEAQEEGRALHERLGEFSDLVAGEAADHGLADVFAASRGERAAVTVAGVRVEGRVVRAAEGWIVLATGSGGDVIVSLEHVEEAVVSTRGHAGSGEGLSLASPLRALCEERVVCAIAVVGAGGGVRMRVGRIARVARDCIEVVDAEGAGGARDARGGRRLIPLSRIAHVRRAGGAA